MRYLCLVYSVEDPQNVLSGAEQQALVDEHLAYDETLRQNGHFITADALEAPETAAIVRVGAHP
jgi:hypothetical protein